MSDHQRQLTRDDVNLVLHCILETSVVIEWWDMPVMNGGKSTPDIIWGNGDREAVMKMAVGYLDTSYT